MTKSQAGWRVRSPLFVEIGPQSFFKFNCMLLIDVMIYEMFEIAKLKFILQSFGPIV